jgi:hypothetical protein
MKKISLKQIEGLENFDPNRASGGGGLSRYKLVTISPTSIINNKVLLPSKPEGDLLLGLMMVFDNNGDAWEYGDVEVVFVNNRYYAQLQEPEDILGTGVVSYLTEVVQL